MIPFPRYFLTIAAFLLGGCLAVVTSICLALAYRTALGRSLWTGVALQDSGCWTGPGRRPRPWGLHLTAPPKRAAAFRASSRAGALSMPTRCHADPRYARRETWRHRGFGGIIPGGGSDGHPGESGGPGHTGICPDRRGLGRVGAGVEVTNLWRQADYAVPQNMDRGMDLRVCAPCRTLPVVGHCLLRSRSRFQASPKCRERTAFCAGSDGPARGVSSRWTSRPAACVTPFALRFRIDTAGARFRDLHSQQRAGARPDRAAAVRCGAADP